MRDYVTDIYKRRFPAIDADRMPDRLRLLPQRRRVRPKNDATRNSCRPNPATSCSRLARDGVAEHTEIVTGYQSGVLCTIGGNSGPSNVDGFGSQGGVHRHRWTAPAGHGNDQVLVVIDTAKVVRFGGPAHLTNAGMAPPDQPRLLMLKSPMMTGADVRAVQNALNLRNHAGLAADGTYGPLTRDAVLNWQRRKNIGVDGIVGPQTRSSLGLPT